MEAARALIHRHRHLASLLVALALCMKLLVPTGFMPVMAGGAITLVICPGTAPASVAAPAHEMAGMTMSDMTAAGHEAGTYRAGTHRAGMHQPGGADHDEGTGGDAQAGMPCAFAGLAVPSLAAIDPVVLAIAIAGLLAILFRLPERVPARAAPHVRPPTRGPPATI